MVEGTIDEASGKGAIPGGQTSGHSLTLPRGAACRPLQRTSRPRGNVCSVGVWTLQRRNRRAPPQLHSGGTVSNCAPNLRTLRQHPPQALLPRIQSPRRFRGLAQPQEPAKCWSINPVHFTGGSVALRRRVTPFLSVIPALPLCVLCVLSRPSSRPTSPPRVSTSPLLAA